MYIIILIFLTGLLAFSHPRFISSIPTPSSVSPHIPCLRDPPKCEAFSPVSIDKVAEVVLELPDTDCDLDSIPSSFENCLPAHIATITININESLTCGIFTDLFNSVHSLH